MENSTQALLIAGAILIGVVVCSIFVAIFMGAANFARDIEGSTQSVALQKYNDQFEKYLPKTNESKKEISRRGCSKLS